MKLSSVNYVSALVAAVVGFVFGFIWYSPFLFGDVWMQGMNLNPESFATDGFVIAMGASLVLNLIVAVVTAVFANALGCRGLGGAVSLSLWLGGGIIIANMIGGYIFVPFGWQVAAIDIVYVFLRTVIFCLFACLWTKKTA